MAGSLQSVSSAVALGVFYRRITVVSNDRVALLGSPDSSWDGKQPKLFDGCFAQTAFCQQASVLPESLQDAALRDLSGLMMARRWYYRHSPGIDGRRTRFRGGDETELFMCRHDRF